MSEARGFLAHLPAFEQMVQAQQQVIQEARAAADEAAAREAEQAQRQTELAACIEAAYLIASADGVTTAEEVSHIVDRMGELTDALGAEDVGALLAHAGQRLEREGKEAMIASIAERLTDDDKREGAFLVAANVSWTGGGIGQQEGLMLQAIARAFGWEIPHMHKLLAKARG